LEDHPLVGNCCEALVHITTKTLHGGRDSELSGEVAGPTEQPEPPTKKMSRPDENLVQTAGRDIPQ
jgi:hypothetical protein